jgi:catalase
MIFKTAVQAGLLTVTFLASPVTNPQAALRIGNQLRSTLLLQDINLLEVIAHIDHEPIPER